MEKAEARRRIRQALEGLTPAERAAKSEAIRGRLRALRELRSARVVMGFMPMPDELDLLPALGDMIADGKRVYVPRTYVKERRMVPIRLADIRAVRRGQYDILEPDSGESCKVEEIDFLVVPARGFDRRGNRLGRGAGFYDRFMAGDGFRALTCGVAFARQVLADLPYGRRDVPVSILVTEDETIRIPDSRRRPRAPLPDCPLLTPDS